MDEENVRIFAVVIAVLLASSGAYFYFVYPSFGNAAQTGFNFKGCINHGSFGSTCTGAVSIPLADTIGQPISSISINASSGAFTYQGTPSSWAFNCAGTVNFGNGIISPIAATASGSGPPPPSWRISVTPAAWTPSSIFGTAYGQKNVTAIFGSKTAPCQLTVAFAGAPSPIVRNYGYAKKVSWLFNYQSIPPIVTTSTVTVTQTSTTTQTSTFVTTTGTSVTSSASNIWITTATSATNGVKGNQMGNGAIMTVAPYSVQGGYAVVWLFIPAAVGASLPSCNSGTCGQVTIVTNSTSVSVFGIKLRPNYQVGAPTFDVWIQVSVPVSIIQGQLVIGKIDQLGDSTNLDIFNSLLTVSPSVASNQLNCAGLIGQQTGPTCHIGDIPPPPYDAQYYAWFNGVGGPAYIISATATSATTSTTTSSVPCVGKACYLSVVAVTF